ncbi:MAG: hypothetical protein HYY96_14930 [Candidatus Tectomicrobia bacterium]|nr:hypothetical protein [Candidatus Tectomicrobia bacterium]
MRRIKKGIDAIKRENPNFAEIAAQEVWKSCTPAQVADAEPRLALRRKTRERVSAMRRRAGLVIGVPRVLNMYSTMPFFSAYFESLGMPHKNLVYSDFTTDRLYREGAKRGAIDPCFPSKVAIPHIHNLITEQHRKKKLHLIFFPMIADLPTFLVGVQGSNACPTVTATPATVKAAFIKEGDVFAEHGIAFLNPILNLREPALCARQLLQEFGPRFGLSQEENRRAVQEGYAALERFSNGTLRRQARQTLDRLVAEDRLGLVVLARPYHNDPGLNHEILEEFQKLGYPVFTIDSLPLDKDLLEELFGAEIAAGEIPHALSIADVWKNAYSENTSRKLWAAKFTARHPNLVALELSNFKCGHDAPIYAAIEEIIERSGTPYFSFKDIDENKPAGSIKIRIETIAYFLQRYREELLREKAKRAEIEARLRAFEAELRGRADHVPAAESLREDEACLAAAG